MTAAGRLGRPARSAPGFGLPASVAVHAGLITVALVAWQNTPPLTDPEQIIAVEVISPATETLGSSPFAETEGMQAEVPRPPAPAEAATNELAPAAPDPQLAPALEPEPAPAPPQPAPPPPAAVVPPPPPKAEPRRSPPPPPPPPPAAKAEARRTPPPPPRPAPPPPRPSPPAATRPAPPPPRPAPPAAGRPAAQPAPATPGPQAKTGPTSPRFDISGAQVASADARTRPATGSQGSGRAGGRGGSGSQLTGDLKGMLLAQIKDTYAVPLNYNSGERVVVVLAINLTTDGTVRGTPRVLQPANYTSDPGARVAVEAALRAVSQRRQFDLPEDRYDEWQSFQFRFDPRELLD